MRRKSKPKPAKKTAAGADAVAAIFKSYPVALRRPLLRLRRMILQTAAATKGVGALRETLKWGQPSYLTEQSKSGTTIRIDAIKGDPRRYALYVNCQTDLLETWRALYPDSFTFGGNRSIEFVVDRPVDAAALRHCIGLALTYRRRKAASR